MGNGCSIDTQYSNVIYIKPTSPIYNVMQKMDELEEDNIIIDIDSKIKAEVLKYKQDLFTKGKRFISVFYLLRPSLYRSTTYTNQTY